VTRNIGNDTRFQAGSKSFGPSIAFTMRHVALERAGDKSINALSRLLHTGVAPTPCQINTLAFKYSNLELNSSQPSLPREGTTRPLESTTALQTRIAQGLQVATCGKLEKLLRVWH